jgi:hypothetical protein
VNIKTAKRRVKAMETELPARTVGILLLDAGAQIPKAIADLKNIVVLVDGIIEDKPADEI